MGIDEFLKIRERLYRHSGRRMLESSPFISEESLEHERDVEWLLKEVSRLRGELERSEMARGVHKKSVDAHTLPKDDILVVGSVNARLTPDCLAVDQA